MSASEVTSALYRVIANAIAARKNCEAAGNTAWLTRWESVIDLCNDELPSGSGFDLQAKIAVDESDEMRIVIYGQYHAIDENGYYDGWRDFTLTASASLLCDLTVDVFCEDDDLEDYIADVYREALRAMVPQHEWLMSTTPRAQDKG